MALTITIPQLSAAVRVTATETTPAAPHLTILTRQLAVADNLITQYVGADTTVPDEVKNEAAVLIVGYLLDAPPVSANPQSAFELSGAMALLAPWRPVTDEDASA